MEEINNEFILDDEYAPKLRSDIPLGDKKEELEFLILKIPTEIPGEINITLLEKNKENIREINNLLQGGNIGIEILGCGNARNTNAAELMYGLNFSTRNLFRSSIGNIAKSFTDSDKEIRLLMNECEAE